MIRKNSYSSQIFMSIVALVLILMVGVGVTYSWIEEGKNASVKTDKSLEVKTKGRRDTLSYGGTITLDPDSSNPTLSIFEHDELSNLYQDLVFCPVYSLDGNKYIFSENNSIGQISAFRYSTTNDIGTKFIKFDFDVIAAKKCILAFSEKPTITATKNGNSDIDTTAFKIMISYGSTSHIFTTADRAVETTVATELNWPTSQLKAKPFDDYVYNQTTTNKLFDYDQNEQGNISVAVWVDAGATTEQVAAIQGCDVSINMELIAVAAD